MSTVATSKPVGESESNSVLRRILLPVVAAIEPLALSLWLGGLLVIGAVVAPVAFHAMRNAPALQGNPALQNQIAGSVVGGSLKVLNTISIVCAAVLLLSLKLRGEKILGITGYCISVAFMCTLFQQFALFPSMDRYQANGNMTEFDFNHHVYVNITYFVVALLLASQYFRHSQRNPNGS
jgi:hypothetical protein